MTAKLCGAKTRGTGQACKRPGSGKGGRCRNHGGLSTGPRSAEGIARIVRANKRRARKPRLFTDVSERQERKITKLLQQAETQRRLVHKVDAINEIIDRKGLAGIQESDVDELMAELAEQVAERCRNDKALLAKLPPYLRRELEKEAALAPLERKVRAMMERKGLLASTVGAEAAVSRMPADRVRRFERHAQKQAEDARGRELRARVERPTSYVGGDRAKVFRSRLHG